MKSNTTFDSKTLNLKLLMGNEICIDNIHIKPLTIREITDMGLDTYYSTIGLCTITLEKLIDAKENEIPKELKLFNVLLYNDMLRNNLLNFLNIFICHDDDGIRYAEQINEFMIFYNGNCGRIGERNIHDIFHVIQKMYCVGDSKKDETKYVNDEVAQAFKEFEEWEESLPKPKNTITLSSIIIGLVSRGIYTFNTIQNDTIYQVMQVYKGVEKNDNYSFTMKGIYSGCVDTKKIKIDEQHWAIETGD